MGCGSGGTKKRNNGEGRTKETETLGWGKLMMMTNPILNERKK